MNLWGQRLLRLALRLRASTSGRTILKRKAGEGRRGEDPKSDFGPSGSTQLILPPLSTGSD